LIRRGNHHDGRNHFADNPDDAPQHCLITKREQQFGTAHPRALAAAQHDAPDMIS
jgi:hypothetical protein